MEVVTLVRHPLTKERVHYGTHQNQVICIVGEEIIPEPIHLGWEKCN